MGLEKFLKAYLLFHRHQEYEALPDAEAKKIINRIAASKEFGHNFESMLEKASALGNLCISKILTDDFDGYLGGDLVKAVEDGYMETRYPVPIPVSDNFPIGNGYTHDPLSSSGITKFIHAVSKSCFQALEDAHVDFSDKLIQFQNKFRHKESFGRFANSFGLSITDIRPVGNKRS